MKRLRLFVLALAIAFGACFFGGSASGPFGLSSAAAEDNVAYIVAPCGFDYERRNGHCVELSPREKADRDRRNAEERARKAKFEADVKAEMNRLGAHREKEIRARLGLEQKAAAARPKAPPRQCTKQMVSRTEVFQGKDRVAAVTAADRGSGSMCGGGTYAGSGSPSCRSMAPLQLKQPPIGDCLACQSEKMARAQGWTPERGWPEPAPRWECAVTAQCEVEKCTGGGPAGASRQ